MASADSYTRHFGVPIGPISQIMIQAPYSRPDTPILGKEKGTSHWHWTSLRCPSSHAWHRLLHETSPKRRRSDAFWSPSTSVVGTWTAAWVCGCRRHSPVPRVQWAILAFANKQCLETPSNASAHGRWLISADKRRGRHFNQLWWRPCHDGRVHTGIRANGRQYARGGGDATPPWYEAHL